MRGIFTFFSFPFQRILLILQLTSFTLFLPFNALASINENDSDLDSQHSRWTPSEEEYDDYGDQAEHYYERQGILKTTAKALKRILLLPEEDRRNLLAQPLPHFKHPNGHDYASILLALSEISEQERDSVMSFLYPTVYTLYTQHSYHNRAEDLSQFIRSLAKIPLEERKDVMHFMAPYLHSLKEDFSFVTPFNCPRVLEAISEIKSEDRKNVMSHVKPLLLEHLPKLLEKEKKWLQGYSDCEYDWNGPQNIIKAVAKIPEQEREGVIYYSLNSLEVPFECFSGKQHWRKGDFPDHPDMHSVFLDTLEVMSTVPPQERKAVVAFSKTVGMNNLDSPRHFSLIVKAATKVPKQERETLSKFLHQFFPQKGSAWEISTIIEHLSKVPSSQRATLVPLSEKLVLEHQKERQARKIAEDIKEMRQNSLYNPGLSMFSQEEKKTLMKMEKNQGNNPTTLQFIERIKNASKQEINKSPFLRIVAAHSKDEGNDSNLRGFIKILSEIPEQERTHFFKEAQRLLQKTYEQSAQSILKALARVPAQERENVVLYAQGFLQKRVRHRYDRTQDCPGSIVSAIAEISAEERENVVYNAQYLIKKEMEDSVCVAILKQIAAIQNPLERNRIVSLSKAVLSQTSRYYDNVVYVIKSITEIKAPERENVIKHAKKLIRYEMENNDIIPIIEGLSMVPEEERSSLVQMINSMIAHQKKPNFHFTGDNWGGVTKSIAQLPVDQRAPLVELINLMIKKHQEANENENDCSRGWHSTIEALIALKVEERKDVVHHAMSFIDSVCDYTTSTTIKAIGEIKTEERGEVLNFTRLLLTAAAKHGEAVSIIKMIGSVPEKERKKLVFYTLPFLSCDQKFYFRGFSAPEIIMEGIMKIPPEETQDILMYSLPLMRSYMSSEDKTKIIQRITKVKKEDRLNILLKASPIISNLKDPKWENICHIIDDTDKIPTIKDPSSLQDNFILTYGRPLNEKGDQPGTETYDRNSATKYFRKSFDDFITYYLRTLHSSWWPRVTRVVSGLSEDHKKIMGDFAEPIVLNLIENPDEFINVLDLLRISLNYGTVNVV